MIDIKLLFFSIFICCFVFVDCDQWVQRFHDNEYTSQSTCDPIINGFEWTAGGGANLSAGGAGPGSYTALVLSDETTVVTARVGASGSLELTAQRLGAQVWSSSLNLSSPLASVSSVSLVSNEVYLDSIIVYVGESNGLFFRVEVESGNVTSDSFSFGPLYSCTQPHFIDRLSIFYTLCSNGNSSNVYSIEVGQGVIQLGDVVSAEALYNGSLPQTAGGGFDFMGYYYFNDVIYMVYLDYTFNSTGLVSVFDITMQRVAYTWTPSYHASAVTYIFHQVNPVVTILSANYISLLMCVNGTSLYLDTYSFNGARINSQMIVRNVECKTNIANSKIGLLSDGVSIVVMFNLLNGKGTEAYIGIITSYQYIHWVVNGDTQHLMLDFALTAQDSVYICTAEALLLLNYTSKALRSVSLPDDARLSWCSISVGENMAVLSAQNGGGEILQMTAVDSYCFFHPCPVNMTCAEMSCICADGYYPVGVCSVYCDSDDTCNGHGTCSDIGECECDSTTGYAGATCSVCKKGYFGDNCNFHFDKVAMIAGGSIALLCTSGICIFWIATKPRDESNDGKPSRIKLLYYKLTKLFGKDSYVLLPDNQSNSQINVNINHSISDDEIINHEL